MTSATTANDASTERDGLGKDKNPSEKRSRPIAGWELSDRVGTDDVPACLRDIMFEGIDDSPEMMVEAVRLLALYMKSEGVSVNAAVEDLRIWPEATGNLSELTPAKTEDVIRQAYGSLKHGTAGSSKDLS